MIYDLLAPFYDAINEEIDYRKWADFIQKRLSGTRILEKAYLNSRKPICLKSKD